MSTKAKPTVVESHEGEGRYGMAIRTAVVDHPEYGRLLIQQGFGGMDSPRGGAYRWDTGIVVRLKPGDTIKSLRASAWNDCVSGLEAALKGHDPERPVAEWKGAGIDSLARGLGL